jgi:hypothetical protein
MNLEPPGVQFAGNSAEWIMEEPNNGWPNTSLPKFAQVQFNGALAAALCRCQAAISSSIADKCASTALN